MTPNEFPRVQLINLLVEPELVICRCFYIAEYLATLKRWKESLALYSRAGHYHATRIVTAGDEPAAAEWERLRADLEHSKFYALAHSVLDGEGGEDAQAQATKLLRSRKVPTI